MNSKRLCCGCKERFTVESMIKYPRGWFCTLACAVDYANRKTVTDTAKRLRKEQQAAKERVKTRGEHLKEAQAIFNRFIRLRDDNEPCISCQRHHSGQYHAGHYRTVGSTPELRFSELNCHKQCSVCNNHLSGNLIKYRIHLIEKIGQTAVDWLEGDHELQHLKVEDVKAIKTKYRKKIKELTRGEAN